MPKNDGGPAFPRGPFEFTDKDTGLDWFAKEQTGMSLRDWFAGMALMGCMAHDGDDTSGNYHTNSSPGGTSEYCYRHADAMLAERDKL